MKNHLYLAIAVGLLLAFACPTFVAAQAASKNPPVVQPQNSKPSYELALRKAIEKAIRELEQSDVHIKKQVKLLGNSSVSDIAFQDVFRMLHLQKAELAIEVEGLNARLDLLKREAEKATSGGEESESSKIQREACERRVELAKKRVKTTRRLADKGARNSEALASSEHELKVAELQLRANRARAKQASPGLVEEMFKTTLEIAEKKARQKTVQSMLQNYEDSRSDFSKLEDLRRTRSSLESRREELMREMWNIGGQGADF